ncbi:MAG: FkbM family methyltransferase, partial [Steroidobacteraceae bacterium]
MKGILYAPVRAVWLSLRWVLELFVPRERLDAWLGSIGFFRWKDDSLVFRRELADGTVLMLHPDDEKIVREIHENGCYSRASVAADDVVVDVGSHVGVFCVRAARMAKSGRVIAVEPAPSNRKLLLKNIELNRLSNVRVLDCALSERPGEAE